MAPSKDGETSTSRREQELNPFIAFRRFADEQISSLVHGIEGLAFSSPKSTGPRSAFDDEAWLREARSERLQLARETEEANGIVNLLARAHNAGARLDLGSGQDNEVEEVLRCPYRPADQEVPIPNQSSMNEAIEAVSPMSQTISLIRGLRALASLAHNPYSSLRKEDGEISCDEVSIWRRTFESMIAEKKGVNLSDDRPFEDPCCTSDWVRSMLERGVFGGCWKNPQTLSLTIMPKNDADGDPDELTELDFYEGFLCAQFPDPDDDSTKSKSQITSKTAAPATQLSPPASSANVKKASIISTLTTTERTTLPDGSEHTKVVLKKRFADGREESTETVHTTHGSQPQSEHPAVTSASGNGQDESDQGKSLGIAKQAKKAGWFWS